MLRLAESHILLLFSVSGRGSTSRLFRCYSARCMDTKHIAQPQQCCATLNHRIQSFKLFQISKVSFEQYTRAGVISLEGKAKEDFIISAIEIDPRGCLLSIREYSIPCNTLGHKCKDQHQHIPLKE